MCDDGSILEPLTATKSTSQIFAEKCLIESKKYRKRFRYLKYYQIR